ncbi:hypothetical protein SUGI_0732360 [Cryptomeria japonica]|nr:hypothetical protein SUGI_0732360 [Cryptomeria japonica]
MRDFLPGEIEEAMRSPSLHIAIFSQNYAQSPWCLAELSFIFKTGKQIVPIFYHVQPDDVRYAKGVYADALSQHKNKGRYTSKKLEEWKNALNNVSYNAGYIINNKEDEERLLKNIVNCVLKVIKNVPLVVAKHPVGLNEVVIDFERTRLQSAEGHCTVQFVGIWGMGGSGKTSLAKQLYNNKYKNMERCSFLLDAGSKNILYQKQKKLLRGLGLKDVSVDNIEEGKGILGSRLKSVQVLIVLDDVDKVDQLDALVPKKDNLGCGITMSLKVFGAQLYGISNKDYWEPQLNKISRILDEDIKEKLKMRCDALDNEEKQMFLDCACFFIGDKKTSAIVTWDGSGWSGLHGWERLLSKCLVELDDYVCIRMHDHLKDLGREIAIQQSPYRLWSPQQSPQQIIIADNEAQRIVIRGIMAITAGSTIEVEFPRCSQGGELIVNTSRGEDCGLTPNSLGLKFFQVTGNYYNQVIGDKSRELVWLRWFHHGQRNLHSLSSLKNLRVLELNEELWANKHHLEELWQTDSTGPVLLRELVIYGCSKVEGFPKSIGCLINLKKIVLSASETLVAHTRWEEAGLETLEHMERLRSLHLRAIGRSAVEVCIQSMQKWPEAITVCTRVSVIDSSYYQTIQSRPFLKISSKAHCILLCFVFNCNPPKNEFCVSSGENVLWVEKEKTLISPHRSLPHLLPALECPTNYIFYGWNSGDSP